MASTERLSRRFRVAISLAMLGSVGALTIGASAGGDGAGERSYEGSLVADTQAPVRFSVLVERGSPSRARFEAANFEVECEGQLPRRLSFGPVDGAFVGSRYFEGRERLLPQNDEFSYLFKFEGKLLGGGRAKGFIFYRDSDTRPPPGETYAECSTDGLLRWTAERVR